MLRILLFLSLLAPIFAHGEEIFTSPQKKVKSKVFSFEKRDNIIRSDEIEAWDELTAPKDYVLSNDLYYNRYCNKIWSKQIQAFRKKNPHIQDPDLISIGKQITVQRCKHFNPDLKVVEEIIKKEEKVALEEEKFDWVLGAFGGYVFLSSKGVDLEQKGPFYGVKLGYNFFLSEKWIYTPMIGYLRQEVKSDLEDLKIEGMIIQQVFAYDLGKGYFLGPEVSFLTGKNISLLNRPEEESYKIMGGVNLRKQFSPHFSYEISVIQAVEDINVREHLMYTLGLKYNF